MKKVLLLFSMLTPLAGVCQQKVSEREAMVVATRAMALRGNQSCQIEQIYYDVSNHGDTLMYEVAMNNGYTVLLSGSKRCIPILAIFERNTGQSILNLNEINGVAILLDNYRNYVEGCIFDDSRNYYSSQWSVYLDTTCSNMTHRSVSHFLTSKWGETKSNDSIDLQAYNERCPYLGNCQAPAGSAAVAMGQIMYYWNYPFFPLNDMNTFDWCNMGDALLTTDECYIYKKKAISKLLYDCGSAAQSDYTCSNTQASPSNVVNAMRNYFHYHSNTQYTQGPLAPDPQIPELAYIFEDFWNNVINDIDQGKPILGYIQDRVNKHFFVCDGYTDDYLIRINWGDLEHNYNGEYSIVNALDLFLLFDIYPKIRYNIGEYLNLTDYYTFCTSQAGSLPLYSIVPYTSDFLTSASIISNASWRTIPTGATAVYQAHEEIILQNGFEAQLGCEFEARIDPCEQCEELRGESSSEYDENFAYDDYYSDDENLYSTGKMPQTTDPDLFPNPTDGPLTMSTDGEAEEVFVHTLDGRLVGGWKLTALGDGFVTLDVSPLRPGPYLLSVTTPSGTRTARFLRR